MPAEKYSDLVNVAELINLYDIEKKTEFAKFCDNENIDDLTNKSDPENWRRIRKRARIHN